MRRPLFHFVLLSALLAAFFLVAREQPLVRNSLVYARAAWNVVEAGFDPRPVVADSHLSYDKPVGFAWLAAPFVAGLGAHDGLRVVSLLGTIAYLAAAWFLARTLMKGDAGGKESDAGRARREIAVLWLAGFGPLVAYQAWSAHPDSWFAALFTLAVALTHRLAVGSDDAVPRRSLALGATLLAAFLLKNYALILVPACALHLALHVRAMRREGRSVARRVAWCGGALIVVTVFVVAARYGRNPLSRLEGEGGGADQYAFAQIGSIWWKTLAQVGLALVLQLHVTLLLLARRGAWRGGVAGATLSFGVVYVAGLLPFPTAFYNMRYFLPLFPLVAVAVVNALETTAPRTRVAVASAFLALNAATALLFNVPALFDRARPWLPDTKVEWLANGPPLALLDNLRMEQHRDQAAWLDAANREVEPNGVLYMLDVVYYRDAQQHVFERDGFLRHDLVTRYASRRDFKPTEARCWVWSYSPLQAEKLAPLGHVTSLGNRLFRIERDGE
jgi:hypothetical protein